MSRKGEVYARQILTPNGQIQRGLNLVFSAYVFGASPGRCQPVSTATASRYRKRRKRTW